MRASLSWQRGAEVSGTMADTSAPDYQWVESFRAGNEEAFDRIFLKYQDYVYNICLGILGNPDDACDSAQETFLRVHRNLGKFHQRASLSTWIYRIAVNECLGRLRRRRPQPPIPLEDPRATQLADDAPDLDDGLVRAVVDYITLPVIVGGGIRDAATARAKVVAGAGFVVTGTAVESDPGRLRERSAAVHIRE